MKNLIGKTVVITDVISKTEDKYTISNTFEDGLIILGSDGWNSMWLPSDIEFNKFKAGETAWIHYDEVTAKIID
tara:strand:+ start:460 stop:681 length:222 start_codon:yes stop_codon:yes gene_type:complete